MQLELLKELPSEGGLKYELLLRENFMRYRLHSCRKIIKNLAFCSKKSWHQKTGIIGILSVECTPYAGQRGVGRNVCKCQIHGFIKMNRDVTIGVLTRKIVDARAKFLISLATSRIVMVNMLKYSVS